MFVAHNNLRQTLKRALDFSALAGW
jgi:hypothetical protein